MDEGCSRAVKEVFLRLYRKGLIYRGSYLVNWCPQCATTLSDIEVEHEESEGRLWHIRYPLADGSGYIQVATTRPETMLGETAVAVHPDDERYRELVGKTVILPLMKREIPVVADPMVDREFGTGAVKITPAHDLNDFELGLRHNLPQVTVIGFDAKMTAEAGKYAGLDRYEARKKVLEDLAAEGLLAGEEVHHHALGACYRCDTVVEPLISKQWFVRMKPLAEPAARVVREGKIRFVPERFAKVYLNWLENIRDWCISRQLWWGHRIPVWYCLDCGTEIAAAETPGTCGDCGSTRLEQDRMSWIPGSRRRFGLSLPWAGRKTRPNWSISTLPRSWSPPAISSSSGWPAWSLWGWNSWRRSPLRTCLCTGSFWTRTGRR